MGADELNPLNAVAAFGEYLHPAGALQQIAQLSAGELFVIDDESGQCHGVKL